MIHKHLILGGARSGKSSFAERSVLDLLKTHSNADKPHYIATATAFDDEMKLRIQHHQQSRENIWQVHECPLKLVEFVEGLNADDIVLIDCLTLWLNNVIFDQGENINVELVECEVQRLADAIHISEATIFMVSNEVGLGVVPLGEVSRCFVDTAGRMNQKLAAVCSNVTLIAAGLPLILKAS